MNKIYQPKKIFSFCSKGIVASLCLVLLTLLTAGKSVAQTTLSAGDIAIIGFNTNTSPDNMVILVLKDLSAGTVFYVNDNEVLTAGGTSFNDLNEAEASFTVKAGQSIAAGTVIVLPWGGGLTSTATYDWSVTAGAGLGNDEEIYIYNAASITSTTPTSFIFGVTQGSNTGLVPNGLVTGTTFIDHGSLRAYRYNITGATYTGTQTQLLAAIGNAANHTGAATYSFLPGDWTFSVLSGTPTVNLSVSANAGTEAAQTSITVTATASAPVSGAQTVALGVSGTGITAGDYTLSNATITIANGATTGSVTFTVVDDILVEGAETAALTISSPSSGIILGTTATQNIAITDNDAAVPHTLAFVRVDTTVVEGVGIGRVFLRVTAAGNTAGTVDLGVSNYSTATGSGTDYSVSTTLNVPANLVLNQLISFDFTINDDAAAEADEYIICKLTNAVNVTVSSTAQSTLYIKDNDKAAPVASNQLNLNFISSFSNGASGTNSAEISAYDFASKRLFVANSVANKLDIVNLTNPLTPVLISSINLAVAPFNGSINSVAVNNGIVALALEGLTDKQANGKVVFTDINGAFISEVTAGAMPDMITFNHAGTKVYTANEGEPNAAYTNDPEGSITVVDISGGAASPIASTINFTAYIGQEAVLRSQGIRIYGLNANAAQDFEPEYITISDDDSKAWVTLQENNALVELNLTTNSIVKLIPLGYKNHSLTDNALDASDQTFGINLSNYPFKGMYLPDAIASYTSGGNVYLITANEGDARAYTGFNEESRVSGLTLDPTIFPNSAELKNNAVLGRLNATNKTGDIDNDGDIDEIYVYGTRSFSIWNPATSSQVYDSKDELERITSTNPSYSQFFNMSNTIANTAIKNRSDDKGPEPEGVTTAKIGGRDYAFVALERIGGVMVYDVTNPAAPAYVTYANSRTVAAGDRGSEGIIFIPAAQSPTGKSLVLLSNEVSSTVSVFEIEPCAAPGIATIASLGSTSVCPGNTIKLYNVNSNASYVYQWLKNDTIIAGATDSVYFASQTGSYKLVVFNANGCADTSAAIALTFTADVIPPVITAPSAISVATNAGCAAEGIALGTPVVSDNCAVASVTNNAPASFPLGNTTVTWTVTDSSGNTATATQIITVADTLKPAIFLQASGFAPGVTGPSSSQSPYLKPFKAGTKFTSLLTVGDVAANGYKMVGIPDGLGAFDNGDGTFTALMHHELGTTVGIPRAHGGIGAFVSKWIINKSTLAVQSGSDLIQQVYLWDTTANAFVPGVNVVFGRFCAADLPAPSAFYNSNSGKGTTERIFMGGEEIGAEGRGFGHIVTGPNAGKTYELPYTGKFSWENAVASPASGNKTVVVGLDDATPGQVYVYVGDKKDYGNEIEKAGLQNGKLFGIKVTGLPTEVNASVPAAGTRFDMYDLGNVRNKTGAALNTASNAAGVTNFLRPEDGAWDPNNPNDFYFATTNNFTSPTRLWRLRFDNILSPETGGTIEAVLTGTESNGRMFDNLSVDRFGKIILQEDPGNQSYIARMWQYNIATDSLFQLAYHDSTRFISGQPNFLTQDEESSGIIDMSEILGQGTYLFDDEAHYGIPGELVEGGQLLIMTNPYSVGNSTAPDTVRSSAGCGATINLGTPATADNCNVASVTNNAPASFPLGTTIVTWTVTDGSGNTATVNQVVIVTDSIAPVITAPASINAATNAGCSAEGVVLGTPVVSDNCAVASVTNNAPASFPVGTTTVTWTVTDSSGNTATATQTVTVIDSLKPAIHLQASGLITGVTGLSSSQSPYLKPFKAGTKFTSLLTVGDVAANGYKMVGIPDGLGAFDNGDGTFTALMHHELGNTVGIPRAHGGIGAFVSKWIINKSTLAVQSGSDLIQQVYLWDTTANAFVPGVNVVFGRFCAADLPSPSAFYNSNSGKGTTERIFMGGEEIGAEGRAFGHIVTGPNAGKTYELPYLGKFSWENSVASPASGNKTVVVGLDDATPGQVYVYVGNKTNAGTEIDKAGLQNGKLFGIKVTGLPTEVNASVPAPGTRFDMYDLGNVRNKTGAALQTESNAAGVTNFLRPEDGAWDPNNPNDFYFATTNNFTSPTRLWRLRFDNVTAPETGGTIEAVLTGTESNGRMFDNLSVDRFGKIILQEDPGNQSYIARMWQYNIATDSLFQLAYHDSTRFISGQPNFLTQDEEASGIIDMSDILGQGTYLFDDEAHYGIPGELVEGGQLLVMHNPLSFGNSTAPDTVRVSVPFGTTTATGVNLGTPATSDNCSVASVTNNAPSSYPLGTTIVTWTVTDASGNTASVNQVVIVTQSSNLAPAVTITSPISPASFNAGTTVTVNVNATDTDGTVTKVELFVNGVLATTDSIAPYSFSFPGVEAGIYTVTAKATDNNGAATVSDTLTVTIVACIGSGTITGEGYTNIPGDQVADLTSNIAFQNPPQITAALSSFEYANVTDNYGARVRGYICVPVTGAYIFHIAADDQAGLWLSTDENAANKVLIASAPSYTGFREWYKFPSQTSAAVQLTKGVRYYIETLHKESVANDHLSVGWTLPGGAFEGPIPGYRLSPIGSAFPNIVSGSAAFATAMQNNTQSAVNGLKVTATPNPTTTYFTLTTRSNSDAAITIKVVDALGRIVETKANVAANSTIQIGSKLPAGMYFVEVVQGEQREKLKLVKQ